MVQKSFQLTLPLGYCRPITPDFREHDSVKGYYGNLTRVVGSFSRIVFNVGRLGEMAFQISIKRTGVPCAQGGFIELNEMVAGLVGDCLTLENGGRITIDGFDQKGVLRITIFSR